MPDSYESLNAFFSGLGIGLSFILAIGAQNAFVLKQGLKRQHVLAISLTCAFSDTLLIVAGIIAHQEFSTLFPRIRFWLQILGGGFLIAYALKSFYSALTKSHSLDKYFSSAKGEDSTPTQRSRLATVLTALAFTWFNPHVYLDTVIVIGSLSLKFSESVVSYTLGAVTASYLFFFSLGYGARLLTPWFRNPLSWKVLDTFIGLVMLVLGWRLITEIF